MPFRTWVRLAVFGASAAWVAQPAFGQTKTGTGTAPTGNTPSVGTTTSTASTTNATVPSNTATPYFISGRVLMDDGAAPPEPAAIERVCLGVTRTEGYTDSRGYFVLQLGNEAGVFQDASEDDSRSVRSMSGAGPSSTSAGAGRLAGGDRRYSSCDIRANLAGYRSQSISLASHRAMDAPDIGVIVLHRQGSDEGSTVSMVSLAAPKEAKKAFDRASAAARKNRPAEEEKALRRAIELYPKFAAAWTELGKLQVSRNELVDARRCFDEAIQADPKFFSPYVQIALLDMQARKWPELAGITARAIRLTPFEYPQIYLFHAVASYNLRNFDTAERSIQAAAKLDTLQQIPEISYVQALLLTQRRDFAAAAERLRNYLKLAPEGADAAAARDQLERLDRAIAENAAAPGPRPVQ